MLPYLLDRLDVDATIVAKAQPENLNDARGRAAAVAE